MSSRAKDLTVGLLPVLTVALSAITIMVVLHLASQESRRPDEQLINICYGGYRGTPIKDVPAQCFRVFLLENSTKSIDNK